MAHVLDCRDVNFVRCRGQFRGRSEDEVVEKVLDYARRKYNIWGVMPKLREVLLKCVMEEPEYW